MATRVPALQAQKWTTSERLIRPEHPLAVAPRVPQPARMKALLQVLGAGCALALAAQAQPDLANVEIRTISVAGNVLMLEGAGGNIGVLTGEEGVLIVDHQFAPLAPKIEAAIGKLGSDPVRYVERPQG